MSVRLVLMCVVCGLGIDVWFNSVMGAVRHSLLLLSNDIYYAGFHQEPLETRSYYSRFLWTYFIAVCIEYIVSGRIYIDLD